MKPNLYLVKAVKNIFFFIINITLIANRILKSVLEIVWEFGFRIAEAKLLFAENAEKFSKKIFLCKNYQKKKK